MAPTRALTRAGISIVITAALLPGSASSFRAEKGHIASTRTAVATCLTTWNPATEPCPCASASLCLPVRRVDTVEKVYVMHNGFTSPHPGAPDDRYIWAQYNWSQVGDLEF